MAKAVKMKKENKESLRISKKIRKGDRVLVIAGNSKGNAGEVLRVVGDKAVIEGLNIKKKHVKKSQLYPQGKILEIEKPIHISNLRLCTSENKPIKLHVRWNNEGQKELYYKLDGVDVLYRPIKNQTTK